MIELKTYYEGDNQAVNFNVDLEPARAALEKVRQNNLSGWLTLPNEIDPAEVAAIKQAALEIQSQSKYLVCIGIGGSYLGHRAVIEALGRQNNGVKVFYAGHSTSTRTLNWVLEKIGDADFSVNVISKSGTTTEPAIVFRLFKQKLIDKYGKDYHKRIYATTDAAKGALHDEAIAEGYTRFVVPDNIGGRYSVLSAVGLLPIAATGLDIDQLLAGARSEMAISDHILRYAAIRTHLANLHYTVENFAVFEPALRFFIEWWKQLFGESEGKDKRGIFPSDSIYTTDLHALGQYIQEGRRDIFETILSFISSTDKQIVVPTMPETLDGLQYLENRSLEYINTHAKDATISAHSSTIPVFEIIAPDFTEHTFGALFYFFETACAISATMQDFNPFDQPGVEAYKNEMFRLLGKPGY